MNEFADLAEWHLAAIDEVIAEADAEILIAHDDVVAWLASWGTAHELPMPRPRHTGAGRHPLLRRSNR
jgi:predicted transcriptional regulator